MPWNGSGQFTRNYSWQNDAINNIPIMAPRVDSDTNDIVTNGLGNCLTRDGQGGATANLPMNGFRHTNCGAGVNPTDYATMAQINVLAPLNSPTFTGTPLAPTATAGTNNTQIATTAFVVTALGSYLPLSGGLMNGPLNISEQTVPINLTLYNPGINGAGLELVGNGSSTPSKTFRVRSGVYEIVNDANTSIILSLNDAGLLQTPSYSGGTGAFSGTLSANGSFSYGGNAQPHIFVQSGTPTAIAVGDLWFF